MKKRTQTQTAMGWMGKSDIKKKRLYSKRNDGCGDRLRMCSDIYSTRGLKHFWIEEDWPPVRVRITTTIEEV